MEERGGSWQGTMLHNYPPQLLLKRDRRKLNNDQRPTYGENIYGGLIKLVIAILIQRQSYHVFPYQGKIGNALWTLHWIAPPDTAPIHSVMTSAADSPRISLHAAPFWHRLIGQRAGMCIASLGNQGYPIRTMDVPRYPSTSSCICVHLAPLSFPCNFAARGAEHLLPTRRCPCAHSP